MTDRSGWHFFIDRGGTFTDVVARDPEGGLHVHKLLSEHPSQYEDAPLEAIRRVLGMPADATIPSGRIASVRMGTTLATNALLERKGAKVGLLITRGFRDLLEIGYQDRPDLFALDIVKPESLAAAIEEIDERVLVDGTVWAELDEEQVRQVLARFKDTGIESIAVLFLHSYHYPHHELTAGRLVREAGFGHVSLSHAVAKEIKAVPRGDTTMVDAYLTPVLRNYVRRVREALGPKVPLQFMQSDGGLVDADHFTGKNAILSGPAGGVIGYGHIGEACFARRNESRPLIGFDMGGTSTDVSRWDGGPEHVHEKRVAGVRLKAPMIAIETVAAGGGSILRFADGRLQVGPESAGANPGPACYGRGGPATVTDANLVLGRIHPAHFPKVFGPRADAPLDAAASRAALEAIRVRVNAEAGVAYTLEELAAGFIRIANENMVKPIKAISVSRGYDVQEHALVCFGGAGAQHACAIAESLGIDTIVLHPLAGVLSAYGIGLSRTTHERVEPILRTLDENPVELPSEPSRMPRSPDMSYSPDTSYSHPPSKGARAHERGMSSGFVDDLSLCNELFTRIEAENETTLRAQGVTVVSHAREYELRYLGTDSTLIIPDAPDLRDAFERTHQRHFGFTKPNHPIEIVNIRVRSTSNESLHHPTAATSTVPEPPTQPADELIVFFERLESGSRVVAPFSTPVYLRSQLSSGTAIRGPALLIEPTSTVVIDPGWQCEVDGDGAIVATQSQASGQAERIATARDPIMLEVFNNLFMSVADQMGRRLENVAHSVNIKERLDFSCALFTADGDLVANAQHIPVHLGAMSESVKAVLRAHADTMAPGDVYATNDPYDGGSHLPDITVVTPVFADDGTRLFSVANRGHHADIGGITPGSMPPFSKSLDEEGVVLRHVRIVHAGVFAEDDVVAILSSGPYPARNIPERLSDLRAQIAANAFGAEMLDATCTKHGVEVVRAYMGHVRANAAEAMREVLRAFPDGTHRFDDRLDSGARIRCAVTIEGDETHIDFTGTDIQVPGNLNAPKAVVVSAVLYVLRTLIGRPIPLNAGCLEPVRITIPEASLLAPQPPAAVVGGNVETSQRIVDVLYGAFGVVAASQGTMNNLTFGNNRFGYYETICGGAGAGPGFHGASAVHTHMTNTRITDPEVMEHRYPVVVREFKIRRGSGGEGHFRGGDGIVRTLEFREPMDVSILSERRTTAPYGLHGGSPGATGRNILTRANGATEELPGHAQCRVIPGDTLTIETPGGGGYDSST